jgi:hypothetical protein
MSGPTAREAIVSWRCGEDESTPDDWEAAESLLAALEFAGYRVEPEREFPAVIDAALEAGARAYYEWATMNEGEKSRWNEADVLGGYGHQTYAKARAEVILAAILPVLLRYPSAFGFEEVAVRARIPDGMQWRYVTTVTDSDAETELLYRKVDER